MLELISGWQGAELLRGSGTAYLLVNAAHILGIGLVLGAILPLDLRLAGFGSTRLEVIGPFSGAGSRRWPGSGAADRALAFQRRSWLVSRKSSLSDQGCPHRSRTGKHRHHALDKGFRVAMGGGGVSGVVRLMAALSALVWVSVLIAGRWIGFL